MARLAAPKNASTAVNEAGEAQEIDEALEATDTIDSVDTVNESDVIEGDEVSTESTETSESGEPAEIDWSNPNRRRLARITLEVHASDPSIAYERFNNNFAHLFSTVEQATEFTTAAFDHYKAQANQRQGHIVNTTLDNLDAIGLELMEQALAERKAKLAAQ